jgi:hypothetical protein
MSQEQPVKARPTNGELARALGVHPSLIGRWIKEGCPTQSIEAVKEWRLTRPRKSRSSASQQRFGNKNYEGNRLEKKIEKWGLDPSNSKYGRKLTPEIVEAVAQCLSDGFTNEETAILCDVQENTIARWCQLGPIKKAVLQRKRYYIHQLLEGTRKDWCRLAWFLERRFPTEFSRPEVAHAIRVSNQTTTNVVQNLTITAEVAEQLAARSASVQTQVKKLFAQYSTQPANRPQALLDRDNHGQDAS